MTVFVSRSDLMFPANATCSVCGDKQHLPGIMAQTPQNTA
jgi:hypothetical protein